MALTIDPKERRVPVFGRVKPATKVYLETLGEKNLGRAIDEIVDRFQATDLATVADPVNPDSLAGPA